MHPRLSYELKRPKAEAARMLLRAQKLEDVATVLEVKWKDLVWVIHRNSIASYYKTFNVAKKNGAEREISAPQGSLRILQNKLLGLLEEIYRPKPSVHSFTKNKSIVTNARQHEGRAWIANIDLKDFYPSIHFGRIRGLFKCEPFAGAEEAATVLAQLVTYKGSLPQGAPTSPILANMICRSMDGSLQKIAHEHGCRYTRYADDLTFSTGSAGFPTSIVFRDPLQPQAQVGEALAACIAKHGFTINPAKVRLAGRRERQVVTGLIVNNRVNVKRKLVREVRAILHAIEAYGLANAQATFEARLNIRRRDPRKEEPKLSKVLRGKIEFVGMVKGKLSRTYLDMLYKYQRVVEGKEIGMDPNTDAEGYDVFICHASTDKEEIVIPLRHHLKLAEVGVWLDSEQIEWGDDIVAKINHGLGKAQYVLVVLSSNSIGKQWQTAEINNVLAIEINEAKKRVLPLLVGSNEQISRILREFPLLNSRKYVKWNNQPQDIARQLAAVVGK